MKAFILLLCSIALINPTELGANSSNTIIVLKAYDLKKCQETLEGHYLARQLVRDFAPGIEGVKSAKRRLSLCIFLIV